MSPSSSSIPPFPSGDTQVHELVARLTTAERNLASLLGPGADAVIDSEGHAHLLRQAQQALRTSEHRYRTLIEKSADLIVQLDAEAKVRYASPAVARILGYEEREVVGRNGCEFFHEEDAPMVQGVLRRISTRLRATETVVVRCRHREGGYRWLESTATNLLDEPVVRAVVVNCRDISERTAAEAALRESEQRFRQLVQALPAAVYTCDAEGRITLFNEAAVTLWGRRPKLHEERWCGAHRLLDPAGGSVPPEDCPMAQAIAEGKPVRGREIIVERPDGSRAHVLPYPDPIRDADGKVIGAVNMLVDITERIRSEGALQASEARYRTMLQGVDAGVIVHGPDLGITAFNQKATEILGVTRAQLEARDARDPLWSRVRVDGTHYAPEDLPASRALATGQPVTNVILGYVRPVRGDFVWVLASANPVLTPEGAVAEVIVTFMDVTARIQAEQAVRDNASFTEDVLNALQAHVAVLDERGAIIAVNEAWRRFAQEGRAGEACYIGQRYLQVCRARIVRSDREAEEVAAGIGAVLAGRRASFNLEYSSPAPVAPRWYRLRVSPLGGGRRGVVVSHHDISETRASVEALRESEKRFRALFEQASVGVAQIDANTGRFLQVNRRLRDLLGYGQEELRERTPADITHPDDLAATREKLARLRSGLLREQAWEKRYLRKDGTPVWVIVTVSAMWAPGEAPDHFIAVLQDITERKQLEEQFRQSQKMEAIGQLSGGVAHDFNNILAVIKGHLSLLEAKGIATPPVAASLREIGAAAERAASLTRQLLLFSRQQVMQPRTLDLGQAAAEMAKMLQRIVGETVQIEVRPAPGPLLVRADPGMIDQILLNLTVNARDAMPRGGTVVIATEAIELAAADLPAGSDHHPGSYVRLSVADTGTGIAPEIRARIFEPFFTTKEIGKGTGLGLATVYGIVQQHGGWIDVQSQPGQGATFMIHLPGVAGAMPEPAAPAPAGIIEAGRGEAILLVEDEQAVRSIVEIVLLQGGYQVHSAENTAQALQLWSEHRDQIALVLTDVVMPGPVTGRELAERFFSQKPGLRVVYMSGYNQEFMGQDLGGPHVGFLPKPFDMDQLLRLVRDKLEGR